MDDGATPPLERPRTARSSLHNEVLRQRGARPLLHHHDALDTETINARIWNGFHFRTAMTAGYTLGHTVADTIANHLRALDDHPG